MHDRECRQGDRNRGLLAGTRSQDQRERLRQWLKIDRSELPVRRLRAPEDLGRRRWLPSERGSVLTAVADLQEQKESRRQRGDFRTAASDNVEDRARRPAPKRLAAHRQGRQPAARAGSRRRAPRAQPRCGTADECRRKRDPLQSLQTHRRSLRSRLSHRNGSWSSQYKAGFVI